MLGLLILTSISCGNNRSSERKELPKKVDPDSMYDNTKDFNTSIACDTTTGLYLQGYLRDGKPITPIIYAHCFEFKKKGWARVRKYIPNGDEWINVSSIPHMNNGFDGFIDTLGVEVIPAIYGVLGPLDEHEVSYYCLSVTDTMESYSGRDAQFGLINDKGEIIMEPKYDIISSIGFKSSLFYAMNFVEEKGKVVSEEFYIDAKGKVVSPGKFDFIEPYDVEDLYEGVPYVYYVEKSGKGGIVDEDFKYVIKPKSKYKVTDEKPQEVIKQEVLQEYLLQ